MNVVIFLNRVLNSCWCTWTGKVLSPFAENWFLLVGDYLTIIMLKWSKDTLRIFLDSLRSIQEWTF